MNRNLFFIGIALMTNCSLSIAQEADAPIATQFNRWSVEVSLGQNKPIRPFSDGYYSSDPTQYFNFSEVNHFDIGVRYMFSNAFGLKVDYAKDQFSEQSGAGSMPFDTHLNRVGVQGVMNLGHLLRFDSFSNRIGLLTHAGVHVSQFTVNAGINKNVTEDNGGVMFGITPQVRLTSWLALTADFTVVNNLRQHLNWDGTTAISDNNLSGIMYTTSVGLTAYIGKKEIHADWYTDQDKLVVDVDARKRLDEIEILMNDTDRDGVPDHLDAENNTPGGVAVDTKGRFIDTNNNGTPDELEPRKSKDGKDGINTSSNEVFNAAKELIEKGYLNIFFDVNKDVPSAGSTSNVYYIIQFLKEHPEVKIKLTGYADVRGNEETNTALSQRRAQNLAAIIIESGVSESRISIVGQGVDTTYTSTSETGLNLARRVSVQIEKQ